MLQRRYEDSRENRLLRRAAQGSPTGRGRKLIRLWQPVGIQRSSTGRRRARSRLWRRYRRPGRSQESRADRTSDRNRHDRRNAHTRPPEHCEIGSEQCRGSQRNHRRDAGRRCLRRLGDLQLRHQSVAGKTARFSPRFTGCSNPVANSPSPTSSSTTCQTGSTST